MRPAGFFCLAGAYAHGRSMPDFLVSGWVMGCCWMYLRYYGTNSAEFLCLGFGCREGQEFLQVLWSSETLFRLSFTSLTLYLTCVLPARLCLHVLQVGRRSARRCRLPAGCRYPSLRLCPLRWVKAPEALMAATPAAASSMPMQRRMSAPTPSAAARKMSGAGLECATAAGSATV